MDRHYLTKTLSFANLQKNSIPSTNPVLRGSSPWSNFAAWQINIQNTRCTVQPWLVNGRKVDFPCEIFP